MKIKELLSLSNLKFINNKYIAWSLFFCVFIMILGLNLITPYFADDYDYSFIFRNTWIRVNSISDVFFSQYQHWLTWGGRNVAHFFVQLFMMGNKIWFDIANSMVYMLFTMLIYFHSVGNFKFYQKLPLYLLINILLWYCLPAWGEDILWLTGSCNYLWTTTIVLAFLVPYRSSLSSISTTNSVIKGLLVSFFGLLAGWSNENTSLAVFFLLIIYFIYRIRLKNKIQVWEVTGVIFFLVGVLLLLLAPGNYVRAESSLVDSLQLMLFTRLKICFENYYVSSALILFLSVVSVYIFPIKRKVIYFSIVMFCVSVIACFVMIAAPAFQLRSLVPVVVFAIIGFCSLISQIDFNVEVRKLIFAGYLLLIFIFLQDVSYVAIRNYGQYWRVQKRIEYIKLQQKEGNLDVVVRVPIPVRENRPHTAIIMDVIDEKIEYAEQSMCNYYQVRSIKGSTTALDW